MHRPCAWHVHRPSCWKTILTKTLLTMGLLTAAGPAAGSQPTCSSPPPTQRFSLCSGCCTCLDRWCYTPLPCCTPLAVAIRPLPCYTPLPGDTTLSRDTPHHATLPSQSFPRDMVGVFTASLLFDRHVDSAVLAVPQLAALASRGLALHAPACATHPGRAAEPLRGK